MGDVALANLAGVCLVAFAVPFLLGLMPGVRIPSIAIEVLAGIALGPSVLGLLEVDDTVRVIAAVGLVFVLFMAGARLPLSEVRGAGLRSASLAWLVSFGLALGMAFAGEAAGLLTEPTLVAIAISSSSAGIVVSLLRDAAVAGPIAVTTSIGAAAGTFAPVVLLALRYLGTGMGLGSQLTGFAILAVVAVAALWLLGRLRAGMRSSAVLSGMAHTSAQLRIRLVLAVVLGSAALGATLGVGGILGAFLAGALLLAVGVDQGDERFWWKMEGLGYGFLAPVFFVSSGLRIDLSVLEPSDAVTVALLVAGSLVARGVPGAYVAREAGSSQAAASGLLQATSLPFLLAVALLGQDLGLVSAELAAALTAAGLVSLLVFPALALKLLRAGAGVSASPGSPGRPAAEPPAEPL